ncbi:MAG: SoxR reducing system RseC family protein [Bacillota bacterium]|jgi:positive regulator of sigma E activity|nr:SoxR reducing system RseC family protein [Bacillota bacterium]NLJ02520.1 SoxR reducing system RseC family protein [Bacillota bacterium]
MRRRGVIIEKTDKEVLIEIQDPARTCGGCKGCIRLTPDRPPEDYIISVPNSGVQYEVGDEVIVDGEMRPLIKAVGVLYGIPFVSLFIGYIVTRLIAGSDPLAGLGAVAGLLLGAVTARTLVRRFMNGEPDFRIVARACS